MLLNGLFEYRVDLAQVLRLRRNFVSDPRQEFQVARKTGSELSQPPPTKCMASAWSR